jgi:hypothetical protein
VYYKVYVGGGLCDLNSFAPRDYSTLNKVIGEINLLENCRLISLAESFTIKNIKKRKYGMMVGIFVKRIMVGEQ